MNEQGSGTSQRDKSADQFARPLPVLAPAGLEAQRTKILALVADAPDVTFFRGRGNIGDDLIHAGTRRLLADIPHREVGTWDMQNAHGHTAILTGGGAWCVPFHYQLPAALPLIEERFERVIILPTSFDLAEPVVRDALRKTKALVFARERQSYEQIREVCQADIGHDCAFFYDFSPYQRPGRGCLVAYRTDGESNRRDVPANNADISLTCLGLDHWLWTIAHHDTVATDRAHVMIAAAMLGKRVEYHGTTYHKVPAIAEYSLSGFPVVYTEHSGGE
ncbi:MAG: polysaccharide pyruvyl transferase family protein [Bryobacteraceae bacterium]